MLQRLTALRTLMANQSPALTAYIVPTADAHNSEYISECDARRQWLSGFTGSAGTAVVTADRALVWTDGRYYTLIIEEGHYRFNSEYISECDARRQWLSGFTGSAGTAVVTADRALVWTDGRYYTQFEKEVDLKNWTLMKQSLPDTLTIEKWLASNLTKGSTVAIDPTTMGRDDYSTIKNALSSAKMQIIGIKQNLVDQIRLQMNDLPPPRPSNEIMHLPVKYTGRKASDKLKELREKMIEKKVSALVLTALDEVAYTLNLRGSDIQYNPVFYSYLVITPTSAILFWQDGVLAPSILEALTEEQVELTCKPYSEVFDYLENIAKELSKGDSDDSIWLSNDASEAIHVAAAGGADIDKPINLISEVSPVALIKYVKNDVELEGFRNCHIKDGIAVIRFLKWLHDAVSKGDNVTEVQASKKLLTFREEETDFLGPSFETISGAGENGAVIHYTPSDDKPRVIYVDDMFLLDSGGQYRDGTTDITRTRHMGGKPSDEQKQAFTRVLKGQINLGSAVFPKGIKGSALDTLSRIPLWEHALDYAHGTGHGVGHCLLVHEGPSGISWRPYVNDPGLACGAVFSNEPGFYKVGSFGIRHEDLVEVISVDKNTDHPKAKSLLGDFDGRGVLGFHTLTLVPNQRECIDVTLLSDDEILYTNNYHKRVLDTIGPILENRGLLEDLKWLQNECIPLIKG